MNNTSWIVKSCFSEDELYSVMYVAAQDGAYVSYIRGKLCNTLYDFFREVSSAMRFPYYFGWNWAAFDECISDLEWLKFNYLTIVIDDYDFIFSDDEFSMQEKETMIKHLVSAVDYWETQNVKLEIIINSR
ncbi:MAG: barstar family protein [Clostridia bacterium]|nr:barstar family protein [Clostridia bacterium]